jgi:hypothetical protein
MPERKPKAARAGRQVGWLLMAAGMVSAVSPAMAQSQSPAAGAILWKTLPASSAPAGSTASPPQPNWQPVASPAGGTASPSRQSGPNPSSPVQWQPLPAGVGGSTPKPILWQPVQAGASDASAEPAKSSRPGSNKAPIQPPTSEQEAQSILRQLPLSWADYPPLLRLGMLPTANVLESNDFQITIGQVSPFGTGQGGGTGLQNYMGYLEMGLAEKLHLSAFYTQSDDPLYATIPSKQPQPSNRWDSAGAALRWQLGQSGPVRFALEGALESWNVKSGATNDFGSTATSCNIFNSNCNSPVDNNNFIGSISAPISWQANKQWQFSLTPGVTFLPASQGNSLGSGQFYGTNVFVGTGVSYRPIAKLQFFSSAMVPLGPGNNSFNSNLTYSRVPIFTGGLRYNLNPRIALEGMLTNGYGQTPSTAILALPSDNRILYAGRLIYTPTRPDAPAVPRSAAYERLSFGGLSVANANLIAAGTSRLRASIDSRANLSTRYDVGFSDEFMFDLDVGEIKVGSAAQQATFPGYENFYMTPGNATVRGGGTALFFSQPRGDALSAALRMSYGRVLANVREGYQFVELINSYQASKNLSFNLNPKLAWSGSGTPYGVGLSANWQLNPWLSVIPEGNLAANGGTSNWTLALRACPNNKLCFDLYGSSALSFQDLGQLLTASTPGVGMSVGWKF